MKYTIIAAKLSELITSSDPCRFIAIFETDLFSRAMKTNLNVSGIIFRMYLRVWENADRPYKRYVFESGQFIEFDLEVLNNQDTQVCLTIEADEGFQFKNAILKTSFGESVGGDRP